MFEACKARVAVLPDGDSEELVSKAASLAQTLSLPVCDGGSTNAEQHDFLLLVKERRLELVEDVDGKRGSILVDFCRGAMAYRLHTARGSRQLLARAIGARGACPTVVDATAGLGRDTFLLAHLGCSVTAVERSPVLAELLRDGLARAAAATDADTRSAAGRITLVVADARDTLQKMSDAERPDVVYIDPMYPPRKKLALGKKELRICRSLVGDDPDADQLLNVALGVAHGRVVVKRQRHAPPLAPGRVGGHLGRTVRYDVYRPFTKSREMGK
ncbi:MAG: class I SAM-dependent methyltransferase [Phycisphaerales bacterium]|nr:MAG: class I SAM-dependent methyltransferase [Phycisphaerales bacterium]